MIVPVATGSEVVEAGVVAPSGVGAPQLLIYDGDCRFCVRRARWFQQKFQNKNHKGKKHKSRRQNNQKPNNQKPNEVVAPWQELDLPTLGVDETVVSAEAVWLDENGNTYTGHVAVAQSLISLGGIWALVGRTLKIPPFSWLGRLTYKIVSANRKRSKNAL